MPREITQEYLKSILEYDPETGIFTWKVKRKNGGSIGSIAGTSVNHGNKTNYIMINIDKNLYRAHRLAFLYQVGYIPKMIDHKDRNGTNNKWENLREANKQTNAINMDKRIDNTSGFKGVNYRSDKHREKRWRAVINYNGKQTTIGTFMTKEEAALAYDREIVKIYGEFAVLNFPEKKD